VSPTLIYAALVFLVAFGFVAAVRAVAREARRRDDEERQKLLREHPELAEIAASVWHS
jgi:2-oxo-4-hydroxy-4-carboxy--5-ureidoimidazoline (OHCU) decarboxylase